MTLGYYLYVCLLIVISSNIGSLNNLTSFIDLFLAIFRFIEVFLPILTESPIGIVIGLKIVINYLIFLGCIIIFYSYIFNYPYSEKEQKWMKLSCITKIIDIKHDYKQCINNIKNNNLQYLEKISKDKPNKESTDNEKYYYLFFNVFSSRDIRELVVSISLKYFIGEKFKTIDILSNAYYTYPDSSWLSNYLKLKSCPSSASQSSVREGNL
jgi:hypothetical protein